MKYDNMMQLLTGVSYPGATRFFGYQVRDKCKASANKIKDFRVEVQKPKSGPAAQQILIFISWTTKNSNKCQ